MVTRIEGADRSGNGVRPNWYWWEQHSLIVEYDSASVIVSVQDRQSRSPVRSSCSIVEYDICYFSVVKLSDDDVCQSNRFPPYSTVEQSWIHTVLMRKQSISHSQPTRLRHTGLLSAEWIPCTHDSKTLTRRSELWHWANTANRRIDDLFHYRGLRLLRCLSQSAHIWPRLFPADMVTTEVRRLTHVKSDCVELVQLMSGRPHMQTSLSRAAEKRKTGELATREQKHAYCDQVTVNEGIVGGTVIPVPAV
jgi:hypothetical protein